MTATSSPPRPKYKASPDAARGGRRVTSDAQISSAPALNFDGQNRSGAPLSRAVDQDPPPETRSNRDHQQPHGLGGFHLAFAAAMLDDFERTRIAAENRVRAMEAEGISADDLARARLLVEPLKALEHQATLDVRRVLRQHPLGPWVKATIGVGEKQAARLLAAIGDPLWNARDERPRRGPGELWQYCGHGDPARSRRRKGVSVEFSPEAKMRTHLIAESCIRHRCKACMSAAADQTIVKAEDHSSSVWVPPPACTCAASHPYRAVYDSARTSWKDREATPAHQHNHALRLVGKAVLRDLFLAARAAQSA